MYEMGKTEDSPYAKGLAFLIHPKLKIVLLILYIFKQSYQNESKSTRKRFSYGDKSLCTYIYMIVTHNKRSLQEILMQKMELKKDFKSMGAFGRGERNERGDGFIEFAEEHKQIIANALFQK